MWKAQIFSLLLSLFFFYLLLFFAVVSKVAHHIIIFYILYLTYSKKNQTTMKINSAATNETNSYLQFGWNVSSNPQCNVWMSVGNPKIDRCTTPGAEDHPSWVFLSILFGVLVFLCCYHSNLPGLHQQVQPPQTQGCSGLQMFEWIKTSRNVSL